MTATSGPSSPTSMAIVCWTWSWSDTGGPATFRRPEDTPESLAVGDVDKDGHLDIVVSGNLGGRDQANGPDVCLGDGHRGWRASSAGLKVLRRTSGGIALGDLDRDGNL